MKLLLASFILLLITACDNKIKYDRNCSNNLIECANSLYNQKQYDEALELYLKAAEKGDSNGHFYAAYRYNLPKDQETMHYIKAAELGHEEGLLYALENLFFQAEYISNADPKKALEVCLKAEEKNPSIKCFEKEAIKQCVEAGTIDNPKELEKKYKEASPKYLPYNNDYYKTWQMAEYAANTTVFGKRDALLSLKLICHGSRVPAELGYAVAYMYGTWKNNEIPNFDLCDFVVSRDGLSFCNERKKVEEENNLSKIKFKQKDNGLLWQINGANVSPFCLEAMWGSGDNYEAYTEAFPFASDFNSYPGKYWAKEIPLTPIKARWTDELSLPKKFPDCNKVPDGYEIYINGSSIGALNTKEEEHIEDQKNYNLLLTFGTDVCEKLLPIFKNNCHSIVYVNSHEYAYYSNSFDTFAHVTYNGEDYILPVTHNIKTKELYEMIK